MVINKRILIVEDEVDICDLYSMNLAQDGYEVTKAYSGNEALSRFVPNYFDIILLDIILPDVSGIDILKKIRSLDGKAKVLMLTNLTADKTIDEAYDSGAEGYLLKATLTRESFLEEVKSYLND